MLFLFSSQSNFMPIHVHTFVLTSISAIGHFVTLHFGHGPFICADLSLMLIDVYTRVCIILIKLVEWDRQGIKRMAGI